MRQSFRAWILLAALALGSPALAAGSLEGRRSSVDERREAAVVRARAGQLEAAVAELQRLHDEHPLDRAVAGDLLVVLHWAGEDEAALEVAAKLEGGAPNEAWPPYVAQAAARAARNLGRFAEAAERYRRLVERQPESWPARAGRAASLAEAAAYAEALEADEAAWGEALEQARILAENHPDEPEALLAAAYVHRLRGAAAGRGEAGRRHYRRALELLDRLLADAPPGSPVWRQARLDRLLTLHPLHRMEEVAAEAAELEALGVSLPPAAASARASAVLTLRRPERAAELYRRLLEERPDDWQARQGLFYALVEAERFPAALELMEAVMAQPSDASDPVRLEAARLLAMGHAYYGDLATARELLEPRARRNPRHRGLQESLGAVYRWRGWPRRALDTARRTLDEAPPPDGAPPAGLALLHAASLLDVGRLPQARREIDRLLVLYPENLHVHRLDRRWDLETGWEIHLDAVGADSRGTGVGASPLGTSDRSAELHVHGPALAATGWRGRPFLHLRSAEATFRRNEAEHRRLGLGLGWRGRGGWRGRLEVHGDVAGDANDGFDGTGGDGTGGEADLAVALGFRVPLGDHWSVDGELDTESPHVPLQARRAGIGGEGGRLAATWRPSERGRVTLAAGAWDFADGNRRRSWVLTGERLWRVRRRWRLASALEVSTSDNSRPDAPYFNPAEDSTVHLQVVQDFLAWRRYERAWTHRLVLGGGSYWQQDFGSAAIWTARYEHDWNLGSGVGLRYGASWTRRVYDGDPEERTGWLLTSLWRF